MCFLNPLKCRRENSSWVPVMIALTDILSYGDAWNFQWKHLRNNHLWLVGTLCKSCWPCHLVMPFQYSLSSFSCFFMETNHVHFPFPFHDSILWILFVVYFRLSLLFAYFPAFPGFRRNSPKQIRHIFSSSSKPRNDRSMTQKKQTKNPLFHFQTQRKIIGDDSRKTVWS